MEEFFTSEVWNADTVSSSIWYPAGEVGPDYTELVPVKKYDTFKYLKMLVKLFPGGHPWRFPIGEPGDYD